MARSGLFFLCIGILLFAAIRPLKSNFIFKDNNTKQTGFVEKFLRQILLYLQSIRGLAQLASASRGIAGRQLVQQLKICFLKKILEKWGVSSVG